MGTGVDEWPSDGVFSEVLLGHFTAIGLGATDEDKMLATSGLHHSGGATKWTGRGSILGHQYPMAVYNGLGSSVLVARGGRHIAAAVRPHAPRARSASSSTTEVSTWRSGTAQ